jgi:serine/threonine-protein kinase
MDAEERPTEAVAALFLDESDPALVPEEALAPGTQVSGYLIDEQIGKGATGVVYAATHPVIGKRVAIKVLRHDLCDDPTSVERFVLEARSVNAIGHPNIVDIFDLGTLPDGRQFLIMDLLLGRTLRRRLADGPLHVSEAAKVIDEIASAMIAAHDKGFIHRDLKPDNVFLVEHAGRHPEVRLLDFGLVKLVAATHPHGSGIRTRNGIVIGTPQYMSPEQARAKNVDHRTDIYALGVMAFELLAGRRPYIVRTYSTSSLRMPRRRSRRCRSGCHRCRSRSRSSSRRCSRRSPGSARRSPPCGPSSSASPAR